MSWTVPWQGRQALLTIVPVFPNLRLSVRIDGSEVDQLVRPTVRSPWAECIVARNPEVKLVQIAFPTRRILGLIPLRPLRTLVFVNGRASEDGRTEDEWRQAAPVPMDSFESTFSHSRAFGPIGALAMAVLVSAAGLPTLLQSPSLGIAAVMGVAFGLSFIWVLLTGRVVSWLVEQRSWSPGLRRLLLLAFFVGVPIAVLLCALAASNQG